jgi:hypothetical protein
MAEAPQPSRSFWRASLAFPIPVLVFWGIVVALAGNVPNAFYRLSLEPRLVIVLLAAVVAFATFPIGLERWSRWIDPHGRGARRTPVADEIDNFGFMGLMMGAAVVAACWHDWTGVRGWHLLTIMALFSFGVHGIAHRVRKTEATASAEPTR